MSNKRGRPRLSQQTYVCKYCGKPTASHSNLCAGCQDKHALVHKLYLLCQKIKREVGSK